MSVVHSGAQDLCGGLAGGLVRAALSAVDAVGIALGGLMQAVGGDGAGLDEGVALALHGDLAERLEGAGGSGRGEPGTQLGDGDGVGVTDVHGVDVGGEVVTQQGRVVEVGGDLVGGFAALV